MPKVPVSNSTGKTSMESFTWRSNQPASAFWVNIIPNTYTTNKPANSKSGNNGTVENFSEKRPSRIQLIKKRIVKTGTHTPKGKKKEMRQQSQKFMRGCNNLN
ncbi:MAG: hypothetical protein HYU69_03680 [Bacteroidetes bacterium]|nr:hypothetical protein [Bacteroidota bacterium]